MTLRSNIALAGGLACFGLAAFALAYVMAVAPTPKASRLGIRGLKRAVSLQKSSIWSLLEPLVRWIAGRVGPLMTSKFRKNLDRQIVRAGDFLGLIPEEYVALCLLGGITGLGLGSLGCILFHEPAVWAALSAVIGAVMPWFQVSGEAQRRQVRIQNGLPNVVDLISLSLSAGLDFPGALRQILEKASDPDDPMIEEISRMLQELLIGKTRRQALLDFNDRCPYDSVTEFVGAVVQAEERGNPLTEVLQIQAQSSRARRSVRAEETAAKAGVTILVPCTFVFIAVLLLIVSPLFMALGPAFGAL